MLQGYNRLSLIHRHFFASHLYTHLLSIFSLVSFTLFLDSSFISDEHETNRDEKVVKQEKKRESQHEFHSVIFSLPLQANVHVI